MKVKQLISILLMLLLLTACSANTDLDRPDEAGSSEQTSNRTPLPLNRKTGRKSRRCQRSRRPREPRTQN